MTEASRRTIRVFISSTFRDMQAERDYLVKFIFPQLRKLCESRGVTWGEVDLRWGVTDEQAAEGQVLPICLEEIKRCRPYFIGLLGERYGWVPQEIPDELIKQEPWLSEHREKSVTELEVIHGVLNNPSMANRACFYFRDPDYVDKVAADQKAEFIEQDPHARQKLAELKNRIRASGLAVRENYPDPQALGRMVLEDLTVAINQEFPADTVPDALEREAAEHEAFAQSRTGVYIGRQEYFERLDSHAAGDGLPLVILGESGCGKSALLANWALKYRQAHPDELLIMHFIGSSASSADWAGMVRRIMGELKRRFGIQQDIPDKLDELRLAFANWLHMAAAKGKVILILDALNQLEDRDGAPDLVWLPPVIPPNVRLIVSTLPGRPLDELKKRNWPTLNVSLLDTDERRKLIEEYLGQYRKTLHVNHLERIAAADQSANPLYLRALLEELRLFGQHEKLDEKIRYYLSAQTVPQLYEKILERYEQDYERERPGLVKDAMSLIWASRRGLSEAELLDLLGKNREPLPRAHWSLLYLAAEQSLVNRSGLISFFHDYLREAVLQKYLPAEKQQQSVHLRLADYFDGCDIGPRKINELPWQLAQVRGWQRLYDLLADIPFFEACWENNQFEIKAYWAQVETGSELRMVDAYQSTMAESQKYKGYAVWYVATLLFDTGRLGETFSLWQFLVEHYRRVGDKNHLQAILGNQAQILYEWSRLEEAMALHKQQDRICQKIGNKDGLQRSLCDQALILRDWGQLKDAMALLKRQEQICYELGNKDSLQRSLGNQALILHDWGQLEDAMVLLKRQEQICRELSNRDSLQISLGNQAVILKYWGQYEKAMALYKRKEQICRELGNIGGIALSLASQANLLSVKMGRPQDGLPLAQDAYKLAVENGLIRLAEQIKPILDSVRIAADKSR